jgi:hypothetical protein
MRQVIYVVSYGSQWKWRCDHCVEQVTGTQAEAIRRARNHVASLPAGTLAQILVQRDDGKFRTEWTYGSDPFPPKG